MVSSKITLAAIAAIALAVNATSATEGNTLDVAERSVDLNSRHEPRDIDNDLVERMAIRFKPTFSIANRPLGHGPVRHPNPALAIARDLDENLETRFPHGGRPFGGRRPFGRGGPPPFRGMGNEARDLNDETLEARFALGGIRGGIRRPFRSGPPPFYRMPNQVREVDEDLEARFVRIGGPFGGIGRMNPPPFYKMRTIATRDVDEETLEARFGPFGRPSRVGPPPFFGMPGQGGRGRKTSSMLGRSLGEEVLEEMERRGMELDELE